MNVDVIHLNCEFVIYEHTFLERTILFMKKNLGILDRSIRTGIALLLIVTYMTGQISKNVGTVLLILSAILLLSSLLKYCPVYHVMDVSTRLDSEEDSNE